MQGGGRSKTQKHIARRHDTTLTRDLNCLLARFSSYTPLEFPAGTEARNPSMTLDNNPSDSTTVEAP